MGTTFSSNPKFPTYNFPNDKLDMYIVAEHDSLQNESQMEKKCGLWIRGFCMYHHVKTSAETWGGGE
jgi:hypothetical protein